MIVKQWWKDTEKWRPKHAEKIIPQRHFFTTDPTWAELGWNPILRGEIVDEILKLETLRLSLKLLIL
jgi:hypothetical protein